MWWKESSVGRSVGRFFDERGGKEVWQSSIGRLFGQADVRRFAGLSGSGCGGDSGLEEMKRDSLTSLDPKLNSSMEMSQAFKNLDNLILESESFMGEIKQLSVTQHAEAKTVFNGPALQKIRAWRSRRRDEKLLATYNSLLPRIKDGEEYLRDLIIQIVEKKLAIRDQARHLKTRLDACIEHNGNFVERQGGLIESMRTTVNSLSNESAVVKAMVSFNAELVRQKAIQNIRHGRSFVSWGSRAVLLRPISEQELGEDEDHPALMQRLNDVRVCREQLVVKLSNLLEVREVHVQNFENCSKTSQHLLDLLRASGDDGLLPTDCPFDHEQCHDCSYVQAMTVECASQLNDLTIQTTQATQRLIMLVELRERVRESGEFLRDDEASALEDFGSPPSSPKMSHGHTKSPSRSSISSSHGTDHNVASSASTSPANSAGSSHGSSDKI